MAETDAELVARARAGDQDACRTIASRLTSPAYNLIVRLVRDPGVAEELTQEAFIKVFRHLGSFDPAQRLAPWVFRIAQNTAIDYLRRHRPPTVSLSDERDDGSPRILVEAPDRSPLAAAELADLRAALDWALSQLRPEFRRLVVMRYQEDLSYEDIATALQMPLGTVKSHLHRARQAMAQVLTEAGWGPPRADGAVKPGTDRDT